MRTLRPADIIQLWETASARHPVDRALALFAAAEPERTGAELAALPLGVRDTELLALRGQIFDDRMAVRAQCPHCREALEFELGCDALRDTAREVPPESILESGGYFFRLRPLNSFDIAAAAQCSDVSEARDCLLQCCVLEARQGAEKIDPSGISPAHRGEIAAALAEMDPLAEILLNLNCPACAHAWETSLDIAHILWAEISANAQRLLAEVHWLARAYGWCENEILALSPARRAAYLRMVSA